MFEMKPFTRLLSVEFQNKQRGKTISCTCWLRGCARAQLAVSASYIFQ